MSTNCNAGRVPVNGGALSGPTLARLVEELFERVDFGTDSIDGLRETVRDQHVALEAANRERDAAIHVSTVNAISGGLYAAEAQRVERRLRIAESALVELQGVIGGAYVLATGLGSIHDIATVLAPYAPESPPAEKAPETVGADSLADEFARSLPPGFIVVGEMLPPGRYEGREHSGGFFEIDPAALPRDVFRSIFGLDRLTDPVAETYAGLPESDLFILEAAEQHGFHLADEAGLYTATAASVIALVNAAREQGRQDVTALASAATLSKYVLQSISHTTPTPEAVGKAIKAIDDALDGLMK